MNDGAALPLDITFTLIILRCVRVHCSVCFFVFFVFLFFFAGKVNSSSGCEISDS